MPGFSSPDTAFDVIICGAGPGGASAALNLRHSGLRVALLDKTDFPRDKICGDALSGKVISVLRHMDPDLLNDLYQMEAKLGSYGIRFFSPAGICLDIPFKSNLEGLEHAPGFVSRRMDFDHFLQQKAIACDHVSWFPNHPVEYVSVTNNGVEVVAGGISLSGKLVIGADGAQSQVARQMGLRNIDKRHHSAGVRAYVQNVKGFHSMQFIELHYLKDLLPGYFWIFPLPNGAANVGLGMLSSDLAKRPDINLRKKLREIIHDHPEISQRFREARLEGPVQGFGLPLGSRRLPISGNRCLLTGDAASLIDPFTGEGIGNAMVSGRIAARIITDLGPDSAFRPEDLIAYDQQIYAKLGQELRVSHMMQRLVRFPWLFDLVARKASRNASLQALLTMMFESVDLRKELTRPSFYWHLFFGGGKKAPSASRETEAP